jgi:hypothetical protein
LLSTRTSHLSLIVSYHCIATPFPTMMSPNMSAMSPAGLVSLTQSMVSRFSDRSHYSSRDNALPFNRSPSTSDFEIERTARSPAYPKRSLARRSQPDFDGEQVLRTSVSRLIAARTRSFTVSGRIPLDSSALVLFFRSKVRGYNPSSNDCQLIYIDLECNRAQSRLSN